MHLQKYTGSLLSFGYPAQCLVAGSSKMIIPFDVYYNFLSGDRDKLDRVYHKGQDKIWDGKEVLDSLFEKHGDLDLSPEHSLALKNILSIIFWGEYVAWNVASDLSSRLDDFGAKMAAVSQAHDEARHFYVMGDYLKQRLNYRPEAIMPQALKVLSGVGKTDNLAKKLLGMQLMVEPIAITIFRFLRKSNVDPLLSELLEYYERDEARHIALGMKYLPNIIKKMNVLQLMEFVLWQIKMINAEIEGLKSIEKDLIALDLKPIEVFEFTEKKQLDCLKTLSAEMGVSDVLWKPVGKIIAFRKHLAFYPNKDHVFCRKIINSFFEAIKK